MVAVWLISNGNSKKGKKVHQLAISSIQTNVQNAEQCVFEAAQRPRPELLDYNCAVLRYNSHLL